MIERLFDQNRYVRESAVRALGRTGVSLALPSLAELFRSPGRVGPGVVYDALVAFGPEAEPVFADALGSEIASVRVASCFGAAVLSEPERARRHRPLTALFRTWATALVIAGRRPGWGSIPRGAAFREEPDAELVPTPLPR